MPASNTAIRTWLFISLILAATVGLPAQSLFVAEFHGKLLPVRRVDEVTPKVKVDGKYEAASSGGRLGLKHVPAYADGFVSLSHQEFRSTYGEINNGLKLYAVLKSDRSLTNCYVVVVFAKPGDAGGAILAAEVPDLDAGIPTTFRCELALSQGLQDWRYYLHFFSGERELLTSLNSTGQVIYGAGIKDSALLARTAEAPPMAIYTIPPDRPKDIPDSLAGGCTVRCVINVDGTISDAIVVRTNCAEFGADAVSAVEQWVLRPAIKNHQFVAKRINIPLFFPARNP